MGSCTVSAHLRYHSRRMLEEDRLMSQYRPQPKGAEPNTSSDRAYHDRNTRQREAYKAAKQARREARRKKR